MLHRHVTQDETARPATGKGRRFSFGLAAALALAMIASVVPGLSPTARADAVTGSGAASAAAQQDVCTTPFGEAMQILGDNEQLLAGVKTASGVSGLTQATAYGDFDGDRTDTPVRVIKQTSDTSVGKAGSYSLGFYPAEGKAPKIWHDQARLLRNTNPLSAAITTGNVTQSDSVIRTKDDYQKDEAVYAELHPAANGKRAAILLFLVGEKGTLGTAKLLVDLNTASLILPPAVQLKTGDLNGDGDEEIVVGLAQIGAAAQLWVLDFKWGYGMTDGENHKAPFDGFGLPVTTTKRLPVNSSTQSWMDFDLGDIDHDFEDELVIAQEGKDGNPDVQSFMLNSDGKLAAHGITGSVGPKNPGPAHVAVGDVNGDTLQDIVVVKDSVVKMTDHDGNNPSDTIVRGVTVWSLRDNKIVGSSGSTYPSLEGYDNAPIYPLQMSTMAEQTILLGGKGSEFVTDVETGDLAADGADDVVIASALRANGAFIRGTTLSLKAKDLSNRTRGDFFEVGKSTSSGTDPMPLSLNLADIDGDSLTGSLGANSFGLPMCSDSIQPNVSLTTAAPPMWAAIPHEDAWSYAEFGKGQSTDKAEETAVTESNGTQVSWSKTVGAEFTVGKGEQLSIEAWVKYFGGYNYANQDERSNGTTDTVRTSFGVTSQVPQVTGTTTPMTCYNYSAYSGFAPVYDYTGVKKGDLIDGSRLKTLAGTTYGSPEGVFRYCKPKPKAEGAKKNQDSMSDSMLSWEAENALNGTKGTVDSQFAVIRPDWSSIALFQDDRVSQSSNNGTAKYAVDGQLRRGKNAAPLARTNTENKPWWQVDLGQVDSIHAVRMLAGEETSKVVVLLSNEDLSKDPDSGNPLKLAKKKGVWAYIWDRSIPLDFSISTIIKSAPTRARYVRVQRLEDNVRLSMTELQVFGDPNIDPAGYPSKVKVAPEDKIAVNLEDPWKTRDADERKMYRVYMYDRNDRTFKWVDQRGAVLANFDDAEYDWTPPTVKRGAQAQSFNWQVAKSTMTGDATHLVHGTQHGVGWGTKISGTTEDPVFNSTKSTFYFESEESVEYQHERTDSKSSSTTLTKDLGFEIVGGGFDEKPDGSKNGQLAEYPSACKYGYTPIISRQFQLSNSGYKHDYLALDYSVPQGSSGFDRLDEKTAVCGLGSYYFGDKKGIELPDETPTLHTPRGVPLDINVHEFVSAVGPYQQIAVTGVVKGDTRSKLELIEPGRFSYVPDDDDDIETAEVGPVESLIRYTPRSGAAEGEVDTIKYRVTDGEEVKEGKFKIAIEDPLVVQDDALTNGIVGSPSTVDVLKNDKSSTTHAKELTSVSGNSTVSAVIKNGAVILTPLKPGDSTVTYGVKAGDQAAEGVIKVKAGYKSKFSALDRLEAENGRLSTRKDSGYQPGIVIDAGSSNGAYVEDLVDQWASVEFQGVDFGNGTGKLKLDADFPRSSKNDQIALQIDDETVGSWHLNGVRKRSFDIPGNFTGSHKVSIIVPATLKTPGPALDYVQFTRGASAPDPEPNPGKEWNAFDRLQAEGAALDCPTGASVCPRVEQSFVSKIMVAGTALRFDKVDFGSDGKPLMLSGLRRGSSRWGSLKVRVDGTEVPLTFEGKAVSAWPLEKAGVSTVALGKTFTGVHKVEVVLAKNASTVPGLELDYLQFAQGSLPTPPSVPAPTPKDDLDMPVTVGVATEIPVLKNDKDPSGKTLTVTGVGKASKAKVELKSGKVIVTANTAGTDSFTYTVSNGTKSATAKVTIKATAKVDTKPVAVNDKLLTRLKAGVPVPVDVLSNDYDPNGKPIKVVEAYKGIHTKVELKDGVIWVTPQNDSEDIFGYKISNGTETAEATFLFNGSYAKTPAPEVDEPPVAVNDRLDVRLKAGVPVVVDVLENDYDPAGKPLKVVEVFKGIHTKVELKDGKVWVTPQNDYEDIFGYKISNGKKTAEATFLFNGQYAKDADAGVVASGVMAPMPAPKLSAFEKLQAEDAVVACPVGVAVCGEKHDRYLSRIMEQGTALIFGSVDFGETKAPLTLKGVRQAASRWGELKLYVDGRPVPLKAGGGSTDTWKLRNAGGDSVELGAIFTGTHDVKLVLAKDAAAEPGLALDYLQFVKGVEAPPAK